MMEEKEKMGLSTSFIKMVAVAAMFIDHYAAGVVYSLFGNLNHPIMQKLGEVLQWNTMDLFHIFYFLYGCMRNIGRISFPIYCFFLVEGFFKTRSRKKYAIRLAMCALISEVPFDLALFGTPFYKGYQNVFFTLLFGLFAIWLMENIWEKKAWKVAFKVALMISCELVFGLLAMFLSTDYSFYGVVTISFMYLIRKLTEHRIKPWAPITFLAGISVLCVLNMGEVWALLALPLICFYRGKKGWNGKWFFYFFYPVHLSVIALIAFLLKL